MPVYGMMRGGLCTMHLPLPSLCPASIMQHTAEGVRSCGDGEGEM